MSGHDSTGRFVPYWYREKDTMKIVPLEGYDVPGAGNYYLLSLESAQEAILEPFEYEVDGKNVMNKHKS